MIIQLLELTILNLLNQESNLLLLEKKFLHIEDHKKVYQVQALMTNIWLNLEEMQSHLLLVKSFLKNMIKILVQEHTIMKKLMLLQNLK